MALCLQYQIPYSHFKGGPNKWTDDDRAKAVAYSEYLKSLCPNCKTDTEDFRDEDGKPLDEPMWYAVIRHCPGCEDLGTVRKEIPEKMKDRGFYATWVASDDWSPDDDVIIDDFNSMRPTEPQAPGLEG
jgi:hypothetical protein